MDLEFFSRALLHDKATTSVEFCPLDRGRDVPKQPANDLGPRHLENCLRRAIECGQAPVTIKSEEALAHALE